ncbi:glycosyltransferase [Methylobacterium sp. WL18]|uniref:glycosyltransferase n=1 Tax=Methylobacterium sp. WL18 TaxID=2603897 RepID=UPI0011C831AF|nr:glycosyltransferase [Methylobacterium sp. WL18]TXN75924.1 glycosyltransferase [Methylobacterium sp. WL18]
MKSNNFFAINGRFLTQNTTGVQRYAMNVSSAVGQIMAIDQMTVPLLGPKTAIDPGVAGLTLKNVGPFRGHVWEQSTLPIVWTDWLLNLCNTAPACKSNQIVCIHDANVFIAPESYGKGFRQFYKALQPILARRSAKITTVSQYSADQIAKYLSLNSSNIAVLSNGHEHVFNWDPKKAKHAHAQLRRYPDGQLRPFVLALGSQARHKNLGLLFGLADRLAALNLDLVIAGGQSGIFAHELIQRSTNVNHLGFVTDHDLAYLLESALCLAFPSFTEGFGLPALEAMALGCPVISTDRASLPEICGNAALLASPNEPELWIEHIEALLGSRSLCQELAGRGRCQATKFSWAKTAEGYLDSMRSQPQFSKKLGETLSQPPEVAVVIATLGRPEIVTQTLRRIIDKQSYAISTIIVSCTKAEDVGAALNWPEITVVTGSAGLASQRNRALTAVPKTTEIVIFFDDDFIPAANWIELTTRVFCGEIDVVGFTGSVIADGIKGPGLTFEDADRLIDQKDLANPSPLIEPFSPYGCNMAFRQSAIGNLRFDERLVLYGWLEDRDFGAALRQSGGRFVKCLQAQGVHLGVKSGRIAGDRLGYSQIINPLYMLRKGTMSYMQVIDHLFRNFTSNLIGSISPEPFIDRRGRLRGNLIGIYDSVRGRIEPERALKIIAKHR